MWQIYLYFLVNIFPRFRGAFDYATLFHFYNYKYIHINCGFAKVHNVSNNNDIGQVNLMNIHRFLFLSHYYLKTRCSHIRICISWTIRKSRGSTISIGSNNNENHKLLISSNFIEHHRQKKNILSFWNILLKISLILNYSIIRDFKNM